MLRMAALALIVSVGAAGSRGCGGRAGADDAPDAAAPPADQDLPTSGDSNDANSSDFGTLTVTEDAGSAGSYLCVPTGVGPFPAVLYNHGGFGGAVVGDLEATCMSLAANGYIAYSKERSDATPIDPHREEVRAGYDYLLQQPNVDPKRLGIIGFSRGGLLTLELAEEKTFQAVVLEAPAPVNGAIDAATANVAALGAAAVLLLVAANDYTDEVDHVAISDTLDSALTAAGIQHTYKVYPAFTSDDYAPPGDGGHELFFELRDYWSGDVLPFLAQHL